MKDGKGPDEKNQGVQEYCILDTQFPQQPDIYCEPLETIRSV